jgi:hypothetical protein
MWGEIPTNKFFRTIVLLKERSIFIMEMRATGRNRLTIFCPKRKYGIVRIAKKLFLEFSMTLSSASGVAKRYSFNFSLPREARGPAASFPTSFQPR